MESIFRGIITVVGVIADLSFSALMYHNPKAFAIGNGAVINVQGTAFAYSDICCAISSGIKQFFRFPA